MRIFKLMMLALVAMCIHFGLHFGFHGLLGPINADVD